jgi:hypothetical protein
VPKRVYRHQLADEITTAATHFDQIMGGQETETGT